MNSIEYKDDTSACAVMNFVTNVVTPYTELVMNGGCTVINGDCKYEVTTTYTRDGETFANLPEMPDGLSGHCAVGIFDSYGDFFVTGGTIPQNSTSGEIPDRSFYWDSWYDRWELHDGLPTPRVHHMCGAVQSTNGNLNVIVAGGYSYGMDYDSTDLVEIYSFYTRQWRTGQSLVFGIVCNTPLRMCLCRKSFTTSTKTCRCCAIW